MCARKRITVLYLCAYMMISWHLSVRVSVKALCECVLHVRSLCEPLHADICNVHSIKQLIISYAWYAQGEDHADTHIHTFLIACLYDDLLARIGAKARVSVLRVHNLCEPLHADICKVYLIEQLFNFWVWYVYGEDHIDTHFHYCVCLWWSPCTYQC